MTTFSDRLAALRSGMRNDGTDVYIIPNADPHLGEYVPGHWRIIPWLTGFTGSAATAVVTASFAGLWTDSRYFLQAERQLEGSGFQLMKLTSPQNPQFIEWIAENVTSGNRIAFDGRIVSRVIYKLLKNSTCSKEVSIETESDLISELWTERPPVPNAPAFDHPMEFCGTARELKIEQVRAEMGKMKVNYHLLTSTDDIMWLLNIRGNDVLYSPLVASFALVGEGQVLFFVEESKIPLKLAREFDQISVVMLPYEETAGILSTLPSDSSVLLSPGTTSVSLFNALPPGISVIEDISIPARLKAIKNRTEIENIKKVMVRDGVALTRFFFWLHQNAGKNQVTEISAADKLHEYRAQQKNNMGASFSTIAAYNRHGAMPHYSATPESDSVIEKKGILLVDSGGQYLDGTTDITRTIALDNPSAQQKKDFTLVLKGTIGLALAKFPEGTRGSQLDVLARKALWENGLNYGHGTGHGVGFFLNVHEGPQNISPLAGTDNKTFIKPGMIISDEPAVYREGEYGIRTENLILCVEDELSSYGQFLRFETLSLCYIDKSLIDPSLLDGKEIKWLNDYHSEVFRKLNPFLSEEEKLWLKEKTEPLS
jgi:Xaa-Pro aminopeptidase